MTSIRDRYVIKENGTLNGYAYYTTTQRMVAMTTVIFPHKVYTPKYMDPLFKSYNLRYESITPGRIISRMKSHEHFLKRLLTRSGTTINKGDES